MPERIEKTIFISYRRMNFPWALNIYQDLTHHGYDVFFDYESIDSGDFDKIILNNIKARAHFIVILSPAALDRCKEPNDWLRREIETALDEKRNIVPLMIEGFDFGGPMATQVLTGKLAALRSKNGLPIYAEYFFEGMEKLRQRFLNIALSDVILRPLSTEAKQITEIMKTAANEAAPVDKKQLTSQEWFERAYKYEILKKLDEAIRCYTEAIRLNPEFADAFAYRGLLRKQQEDLEGALEDCTEAIRIRPEDGDLYFFRTAVHHARNDVVSEIKDFSKVIRLDPNDGEAYFFRGLARESQGDLNGAIEDYSEAIHCNPEDADAYFNRANAYRTKGHLDASIRDYCQAIRLKPRFVKAYLNRGVARESNGDLVGAIQDYSESIRLDPSDPNAYHNRGTARKKKGDLNGSIKDFNEVIRLDPYFVDAYYSRGGVLEMKEDFYAAMINYQKYLDLSGSTQYENQKEIEELIVKLKKKIK